MAYSLNRTFSFENDDDMALNSNEQAHLNYINAQQQHSPAPARDNQVSPPPRYPSQSSPVQRKPVSPPVPPHQPEVSPYRFHPGAHPDSAYSQLRTQRQSSGELVTPELPEPTDSSSSGPPRPPPHAAHRGVPSDEPGPDRRYWGQDLGHSQSLRTNSTITPGMDNLGVSAAGGGIAGIAMGVANTNERESGIEASRAMENAGHGQFRGPPEREYNTLGSENPYIPQPPNPSRSLRQSDSYSSQVPLGAAAASLGNITPSPSTPGQPRSDHGSSRGDYGPTSYLGAGAMYTDSPYQRRSQYGPHDMINPDDIADDGDDGFIPDPKRRSMLSLGVHSSHDMLPTTSSTPGTTSRAVPVGAAAGGVLGTLGGLMGRNLKPNTASGTYGPVSLGGSGGSGGVGGERGEKSEWLSRQTTSRKKLRLIVGVLIGFVVIAAIVGAVVGGVLGSRHGGGGSSSQGESATEDDSHGDLGKDSAEIKALMNNPNLHKVFPGMDYTPFNAQYPACLTNPPSQNNVTRDIAVLSQLTNTIRTYGTDCNQTEMVVHAFDRLGLTDMKFWLGVWVDKNETTTNRQMNDMYKYLQNGPGKSYFTGAIVGNEALFNGFTEPELGTILTSVRNNFTEKGIKVPLATSDLGSNWTPALVSLVDVVMSNVHPFFAGVTAEAAAAWTWSFWQDNDVVLTAGLPNKKQIIAEVGWPSGGGNDCGTSVPTCPTPTSGSIAGVDEMNTFMSEWVCQSMTNGTDYFWFEAFDEPWKVMYNKPGKEWEDKWGLMDPGRKLKPGLKIPSCNGKTVS